MRLPSFALRCLTILGFGAFALSGCSTELDPNADYKETMVIYSLLNPEDSIHYVKVNKAFLNTKSNAVTIAASNLDSATFRPEDLTVRLERLKEDSTVLNTYKLEPYFSKDKKPGAFFSDSTILYRTKPNEPGKLDVNSIYRVVATSHKTGISASGATPMVKTGPFCIYRVSEKMTPSSVCFGANETPASSPYSPDKPGNSIMFVPPVNAYIYSARIDFYYTETTNGVSQDKVAFWYVRSNEPHPTNPQNGIITYPIEDNSFYVNVANQINTQNDNATTKRYINERVKITLTAGSELLALNYRARSSYSIYSQTRPELKNVKNGYGIVTSRIQKEVYAYLTPTAKDVLKRNSKLKFVQ